jgi:hypothetical protein
MPAGWLVCGGGCQAGEAKRGNNAPIGPLKGGNPKVLYRELRRWD